MRRLLLTLALLVGCASASGPAADLEVLADYKAKTSTVLVGESKDTVRAKVGTPYTVLWIQEPGNSHVTEAWVYPTGERERTTITFVENATTKILAEPGQRTWTLRKAPATSSFTIREKLDAVSIGQDVATIAGLGQPEKVADPKTPGLEMWFYDHDGAYLTVLFVGDRKVLFFMNAVMPDSPEAMKLFEESLMTAF
jgi:hypothetical protein